MSTAAVRKPRGLLPHVYVSPASSSIKETHFAIAGSLSFVEEPRPWLRCCRLVSSILLGIEACRGLAAVRGGMSALEGAA